MCITNAAIISQNEMENAMEVAGFGWQTTCAHEQVPTEVIFLVTIIWY